MADHRDALALEGVSKRYGDVLALDSLSLRVGRGELFGFLGPNGAGKSTTISLLTGQRVPDEGRVSVLGTDPAADPVATRRRLGVLPEREDPPSYMTPREYFAFVGRVRDLEAGTVARRVDSWATRLGFREKLDTLSTDLSRGQRQKVMIAGAFLHGPDLVFIDEPLANLDPIVQERVKSFLVEYVEAGNTVFLSTHHIDVAEEICTRVGILREGALVDDRRPTGDGSLLDSFVAGVEGS
ncbi:ABC transporter ATP-binding protein [Halomarina litorea]|uniref:ABC transporter ATP-binding protein n=1 Tax=Halomarina litorea TaxID=2961595 RepID=UPI0020C45F4B|nr:ABC transporter ATP-binding protein [Halomarina sp. BCD28]